MRVSSEWKHIYKSSIRDYKKFRNNSISFEAITRNDENCSCSEDLLEKYDENVTPRQKLENEIQQLYDLFSFILSCVRSKFWSLSAFTANCVRMSLFYNVLLVILAILRTRSSHRNHIILPIGTPEFARKRLSVRAVENLVPILHTRFVYVYVISFPHKWLPSYTNDCKTLIWLYYTLAKLLRKYTKNWPRFRIIDKFILFT